MITKEERLKSVDELLDQNLSRREIALRLGLSESSVAHYAVQLGRAGTSKKVDFDLARKIKELNEKGCVQEEIAEKLQIKQSRVGCYLRRMGVHGQNFNFCKELSIRQQSVLLGTLLGDGHLQRSGRKKNACLDLGHCASQRSWLQWKVNELSVLFIDNELTEGVSTKRMPDGVLKEWPRVKKSSRAHPLLTDLYKQMYHWDGDRKGIRKFISLEELKKVDDLALAVWYGDDGTWCGTYAGLALGNISMQEVQLVKDWLEGQGMPTRLDNHGEHCWVLAFRQAEYRLLFSRIQPHLPPCMHYKLGVPGAQTQSS